MALQAAAEFPRPRIGFLESGHRALAQPIQPLEQHLVAGTHQALVEEQLRRGQDHRAVDIVLHLFGGEIAETHRTHAAIAGQAGRDLLLRARIAGDAVQRLQGVGRRRGDDVVDVVQVRLHRARRAQAVERLHHEIAVAQPAVAIVPVARAVRRLGYGRRQRGEHRAGVFVGAQLERDGRADHRFLPVRGHRRACAPTPASTSAWRRGTRAPAPRAIPAAFRRAR